jgi:hypothetical protein
MNSLYDITSFDSSYNYSPLQHQLNQYQLQYRQVIPSTILIPTRVSNFFVHSPPSPPSPTEAVVLTYVQQQAHNNSSSYHKVFQSQQEQIHQSEIYIPATDYPSPRVDSYDSVNLNNNGIMTENTATSSPPSFSSDLHDTKPVTISGGHGSHEAYPSTPTTYV